jgi:hypothetical protein
MAVLGLHHRPLRVIRPGSRAGFLIGIGASGIHWGFAIALLAGV